MWHKNVAPQTNKGWKSTAFDYEIIEYINTFIIVLKAKNTFDSMEVRGGAIVIGPYFAAYFRTLIEVNRNGRINFLLFLII